MNQECHVDIKPSLGYSDKGSIKSREGNTQTLLFIDQATLGIRFLIRKAHLKERDFPGNPVAKTPCSQSRGPEFNLWSGN